MKRPLRKKAEAFGQRLDVPGGRRKAERTVVRLAVSLHAINCSHPVTLLDVSRTGARMSMPEPMYRGQQVWLKLPDTQIFGFVCWVRKGSCGIAFDEPLTPRQLSQMRLQGQLLFMRGRSLEDRHGAVDWQTSLAR